MKYIIILLALSLAACSSNKEKYRAADDQVLCNLKGQAFYVKDGPGDASFIERREYFDKMCERLK